MLRVSKWLRQTPSTSVRVNKFGTTYQCHFFDLVSCFQDLFHLIHDWLGAKKFQRVPLQLSEFCIGKSLFQFGLSEIFIFVSATGISIVSCLFLYVISACFDASRWISPPL